MNANWTVRTLFAGMASALLSYAQPLLAQAEQLPVAPPPVEVKPAPATEPASPPPAAAPGAPLVEVVEGDHEHHGHFHFLGDGSPFNFKKVPPVRVIPKVGFFSMPPKGEGYYSLRDWHEGNFRKAPPKYPYPPFALMQPGFYDADFRYLDDPKNTQHDIFDPLHRIRVGDDWLLATGGQAWWRSMNETNSRLSGKDNTYDLFRVRVFGDVWYQDKFRAYVEFIDAQSLNQELAPLPTDRNFGDLLNAFIDIKLNDCPESPAYLRIGRQELLFGSQRLISTLDWANTRRTFQGVRAFRTSEKLDVDLFWVQPVIPNATRFDSVDNNQNFGGAWMTYRPEKGRFIDAYYLFLDNTNRLVQSDIVRAPFNVHTLGTRYMGDKNNWLWDVEGMMQFGERGKNDIFAGAGTVGGGYNFKDAPLNPTFWLYYDYASGDRSPNSGSFNTFNQLFPFGHYYFGWADIVGRQNINDLNAHLFLFPTKWIQVWGQYHHFWLDSSRDALYNAAGNASRRSATGAAGTDVGDEFDIIVNFHLSAHSDFQLGYCYFLSGNFVQNTGTGGDMSSLFYAMYNFRW